MKNMLSLSLKFTGNTSLLPHCLMLYLKWTCLIHEITFRKIRLSRQKDFSLHYKCSSVFFIHHDKTPKSLFRRLFNKAAHSVANSLASIGVNAFLHETFYVFYLLVCQPYLHCFHDHVFHLNFPFDYNGKVFIANQSDLLWHSKCITCTMRLIFNYLTVVLQTKPL